MKTLKNTILLLSASAALYLFSGCTDSFENMNIDPLAPTEVSPSLLLPKMQEFGFNCPMWQYQIGESLYTNQYAQYIACSTAGFPTDRYGWNDQFVKESFWYDYYLYIPKNLLTVQDQLDAHPEYTNMYQIMRIFGVLAASRTTDLFGDIPYFDGGKGLSDAAYDSQKDIYYALFKELEEAVGHLNEHQNDADQYTYGTSDLFYNGDVSKWIKLGNSLRLRLALRISFIDPDKAKLEGEAALRGELLSSNAETAGIPQVATNMGHSLWTICFWDEFRVSKTMIDIMLNESSIEDPRLPLHFSQTQGYAAGEYDKKWQGLPNGLPANMIRNDAYPDYLPKNTSCIWGYNSCGNWNAKTSLTEAEKASGPSHLYGLIEKPLIVFNYPEVCFLKAEAALRGWSGAGDAKSNYETGIRASFEDARQNVDASYYTTDYKPENDDLYINGGNVKWDNSADFETKLKQIITQKWIAIYPNSVEAWSEFRRTGYPLFNPVVACDIDEIKSGEFIKKLRYIDDERSLNPNALSPGVNNNQGDGPHVRVWWDTKRYK